MTDSIRMGIVDNDAQIRLKASERETRIPMKAEEVRKVPMEKDYDNLMNKPAIEGVQLQGDKSFSELGLAEITPQDIDNIIYGGM